MVWLFSFTEGMQVSLLHPMDVTVWPSCSPPSNPLSYPPHNDPTRSIYAFISGKVHTATLWKCQHGKQDLSILFCLSCVYLMFIYYFSPLTTLSIAGVRWGSVGEEKKWTNNSWAPRWSKKKGYIWKQWILIKVGHADMLLWTWESSWELLSASSAVA